jgi:HK97 gp10 family phage protein
VELTLQVDGLTEFEARLAQLPGEIARRHSMAAVIAGADVIVDAARANAPLLRTETSNREIGELRDAIDFVPDPVSSRNPARVGGTVSPTYDKSQGAQDPGVWGKFVEYGSVHGEAQPFLRPAVDQDGAAAIDAMANEMREGLDAIPESP